jgi:glycogen debranching enzyme
VDVPTDEASPYYISTTASLLEQNPRTLKHGDAFGVFDPYGDLPSTDRNPGGIFFRDMRYLSHFELRLGGDRPLLLNSIVSDDNTVLVADLTNPDFHRDGHIYLCKNGLHIARSKLLWRGACYERILVRSYADMVVDLTLSIQFAADFVDLFEVRGQQRERRGRRSAAVTSDTSVLLAYDGLDSVRRQTKLEFDPAPDALAHHSAEYQLHLAPLGRATIIVVASFDEDMARPPTFFSALRAARRGRREQEQGTALIETSSSLFDEAMRRATADLAMLVTETPEGAYPYAGVPWFSAPFGRDGLITALQMLWVQPGLARGVLRYLAATQATELDEAADAEPGKILHERRLGEMANLGEVPFSKYYGTIDATPLFIVLAARYHARTGDRATIEHLWPNIERALNWIDFYGDRDGDGFVEYARRNESGLVNQGWKDSHDAIFHADGSAASGPIALCEVQAYVYEAKRGAADLARMLGHEARADALEEQATQLFARFNRDFWCEDLGTYALALDGDKKPCRVRSSNAGQALFGGIVPTSRAATLAAGLFQPEMFSGWGVRTLATSEVRYNPMAYHNGSVWPHDNAMIAMGFLRHGLRRESARLLSALFAASSYMELRRLPELFCGFARQRDRGPTLYPVACNPQAWASATLFSLLQCSLGIEFNVAEREIAFRRPQLPAFLSRVTLRNLELAGSQVDVVIRGQGSDVALSVLRRRGEIQVVTVN